MNMIAHEDNPAADELSAVIDEIYAAALAPEKWPAALRSIAAFVDGHSAALFAKNASEISGEVFHGDGGIAAEYQAAYFDTYIRLDPANAVHFFSEIEKPVSVSSLIPAEELLDSRFYREWAAPQGLVDFASIALEKSAASAAHLGVFRHERNGPADARMLRRLGLIAPHVRRAVVIGRTFDQRTSENTALADTLDHMTGAFFLIDAHGKITHANGVAHRLLKKGGLIRAPQGQLLFCDRQADKQLKQLIAEIGTVKANAGEQDFVIPVERADGARYVAHLLPLATQHRRVPCSAVATLYLQPAAIELAAAPAVIARAYDLTPTELRVLLALVEIGGVPEAAEALGIAESTVKTHLKRIYSKTDTSRQADLVKLMASYVTPLAATAQPTRN